MNSDFWKLGAAELSAAYRSGSADPVAVAKELIQRIEALNPTINAYVALAPDLIEQAEASQKRYQEQRPASELDGVPVAIKDNLHVAGLPTAWGGHTFGEVAATDELPVARLRSTGALIVGKTNTPEFAVEGYTGNLRFGVTRNPWNTDLTPGGSSGGSVAAVAAGLATLAIGTDGGGSTRRPAGHTGLYGLKPGIGCIPRSGGLPQILMDFEVIGTFARNIEDLKLLHTALAGPDRSDPISRCSVTPDTDRGKLRVLSVPVLDNNPCDPEILTATRRLAQRLTDLGHEVTEADLPVNLARINEFWGAFAQIGLANLRETVPNMRTDAGKLYLEMADAGAKIPAYRLFDALAAVRDLRVDVSRLFADYDVILMPTAAAQPWPAEQTHPTVIDGTETGPRGHAIYTGWVNAAGHPSIAVPAGFDPSGMPIGCQLIADLGSETQLLTLAKDLSDQAPPWQWPDLTSLSTGSS